MSTIFSKIISGEIPNFKLYEDENVYVFLDANPMQKGHTLVVSKKEVDYLFDIDKDTYLILMERARFIAKLLKEKLHVSRICVVVEGYAVPHAHVHLIPTNTPEDFNVAHVHKGTQEELKEAYDLIMS